MFENLYPLLIILVLLFAALILFVLSNDWKKLEKLYITNEPAPKNLTRFEYGSVGIAYYRGSLCVGTNSKGIYLSIVPLFNFGLKPILIPWNSIERIEEANTVFASRVRLFLKSPLIKIVIRKDLLKEAKQYLSTNDLSF